MVHENVEHMRQILVDHQRKLDTMANGMETIQVQFSREQCEFLPDF